jgi:hypothetical protein
MAFVAAAHEDTPDGMFIRQDWPKFGVEYAPGRGPNADYAPRPLLVLIKFGSPSCALSKGRTVRRHALTCRLCG